MQGREHIRALAQLVRLPNVFTAWADIGLGYAVTHQGFPSSMDAWCQFSLVLLCSSCFYTSGMALNDFADVQVDAKERPLRPIPSGRVQRKTAGCIGWGLLAIGLLVCLFYSLWVGPGPCIAGGALAISIVAYNFGLKAYWFGPWVMGLCRTWNVLLGASDTQLWNQFAAYAALIVGMYIAGVSLMAKDEANESGGRLIPLGIGVMVTSLLLVLLLPWIAPGASGAAQQMFVTLLMVLAFSAYLTVWVWRKALATEPTKTQQSIKWAILGLIGLDTILAFIVIGATAWVLMICAIPAWALSRWLYMT